MADAPPPPFRADGKLPVGIHFVSWQAFVARYGYTLGRLQLIAGLKEAIDLLHKAGCKVVYVGGSFVTSKKKPKDFDGCWDDTNIDWEMLDDIFKDWHYGRQRQRERFGGELFIANWIADRYGTEYLDYFQLDKRLRPKGIVAFNLEEWQP